MISAIACRATRVYAAMGQDVGPMSICMDLEATHCNGCPLRLREMLEALTEADYANVMHDICGINQHIDRSTGLLKDHFLPRFAAPEGGAE